jgi:hypothetical protein
MVKALNATGGKVMGVTPVLDVDGSTIIGLNVSFNVAYQSGDQEVTTLETFDGWSVLSPTQKTNMQDIRNTIVAAIGAAFLT